MSAGIVALCVLLPKTTHAEAVEDYERMGEGDDDGQRFGAIVVKGELVATANAPGGWTLVRTFENKSDTPAEAALEERIETAESMYGARVASMPTVALSRTQKIRLAANEKKSIGTYLPEKLGQAMTKAHHAEAMGRAQIMAGHYENPVSYQTFSVSYLRPLAPGETAAAPVRRGMTDVGYFEPSAPGAPRAPRDMKVSDL
jgi:hypothetical protein